MTEVCPACGSPNLRAEVEMNASPSTWEHHGDGHDGGTLVATLDLADLLAGRVECDDCGETVASDLDVQVVG